jgi:glycolate oxidase
VPKILLTGVNPSILEYVDMLSMDAILNQAELKIGIPDEVKKSAFAYLIIVLESNSQSHLDENTEILGECLKDAVDVYELPPGSAVKLIEAREKAFFAAKSSGANDIIDVVVPRAEMARYLTKVSDFAGNCGSFVAGCGHVGDGNVHLSVFQPDKDTLKKTVKGILSLGLEFGGNLSGEHGIGTEKLDYFLELEDPIRLELMRNIKRVFDPRGILNPNHLIR